MTVQEIVKAEKAWLASDEGLSLIKTDGFCEARMRQYLENRIIRAFRAGVHTAETHAAVPPPPASNEGGAIPTLLRRSE